MLLLIAILISALLVLAATSVLLWLFYKKVLKGSLKLLSRVIVGLLILQFILGMASNLFATIPAVKPWLVFHEFGPIALHTANAVCLLIFSVIFWFHAAETHRHLKAGVVGCISVIAAFASGVVFVNGGQNNIYSLSMSLGFILAFTAYSYIAFSTLNARQL